jgi:Mn-dependent DtxR family transcriptional regulator
VTRHEGVPGITRKTVPRGWTGPAVPVRYVMIALGDLVVSVKEYLLAWIHGQRGFEDTSGFSLCNRGGGVVLEHRYGATLLASLLTGDPVSVLGDDAFPVKVRFQAAAVSAVDDFLVTGDTPDGKQRRVSIGVRRAPKLTSSNTASVRLLGSYLAVVADQLDEVVAGRWRLALAVVGTNPAVRQLGELADIARATISEDEFRTTVGRPGRTNRDVRSRLGHLDALVPAGLRDAGIDAGTVDARDLFWRMLAALRVRELRLEDPDDGDRTIAVTQLRGVTRDGTAQAADSLLRRLTDLAGRYASSGAEVTEQTLRGALSGFPLADPSAPRPIRAHPDTVDDDAIASIAATADGRLRAEFMAELYDEESTALSARIGPGLIGLRIGIEGPELHVLIDHLEQAGYLEIDYEGNVRLTDAGRRAVTNSRTGPQSAAVWSGQPDVAVTEDGRLRAEFMAELHDEDPEALSAWIARRPIGLRIAIEGPELHVLVDHLEQAGYLEIDYEGNVRLTDAGRRAVTNSRTGMKAG